MTRTVRIDVGAGYDVTVGPGLLDTCGGALAPLCRGGSAFVVSDSTVAPLYLARVRRSLEEAGLRVSSFVFPAGEKSKTLATLGHMLEAMAEAGLTRSDLAVALGGGVTGDMTGFAAGVYQRGISYVQLPTTVLAAVDSSVGGKTAVDLRAGKNMAGVFIQPAAVLCDTDTFATLPEKWFRDGLAESIKYGILTDRELFFRFDGLDRSEMPELIARCVAIKGEYVHRDPLDCGDRRYLNLGHTMAHAMEKLSGYTLAHGHAVAMGTVMAARYGERLGLTEAGTTEEICRIYSKNGLPVSCPYDAGALARAASMDKKRTGGDVTVVLIETIGRCFLKKMPVSELYELARLGLEG